MSERSADEKDSTAQSVEQQVTGGAARQAVAGQGDATPAGEPRRDRSTLYWALGVVALLCVELYFYGRNGMIQVCVAKEGVHDFALVGQMRTDENRWKFPYCEERVNLGLRSDFDELARGAVKNACRRATLLHFQKETDACVALEKHWRRKVITRQVMPWERSFYRRLLWLDRR